MDLWVFGLFDVLKLGVFADLRIRYQFISDP